MLTSIVITKNEEKMIGECLLSLKFCDEVIVVDTGNDDKTNDIARSFGARVVVSKGSDYSQFRNDGLKAAKGDWILYVDADERVTPLLGKEILSKIKSSDGSAYAMGRQSIILGKEMNWGGWGKDRRFAHNSWVVRLFRKSQLKGYQGKLHEQPIFSGKLEYLDNYLLHITHRDLSSMLDKTLDFTSYEAQLRLTAHHPLMAP